jgi:hypothetical protein
VSWEQLEIPGVTKSFRHTLTREAYGRVSGLDLAGEREEDMDKIDKEDDRTAELWKRWIDNPGELRKALYDPASLPTRFEREAAERLRAAVTRESPFAQAAEDFGDTGGLS